MPDPNDDQVFIREHEEPPKFPDPEKLKLEAEVRAAVGRVPEHSCPYPGQKVIDEIKQIVRKNRAEYSRHNVMVMVTVGARNQAEAQAHVSDILELLEERPEAAWVYARVVPAARYSK